MNPTKEQMLLIRACKDVGIERVRRIISRQTYNLSVSEEAVFDHLMMVVPEDRKRRYLTAECLAKDSAPGSALIWGYSDASHWFRMALVVASVIRHSPPTSWDWYAVPARWRTT